MNNVLYQKVIKEARLSEDGESPSMVYVTEEANAFMVWGDSFECGKTLIAWHFDRFTAIELAVDLGRLDIDSFDRQLDLSSRGELWAPN